MYPGSERKHWFVLAHFGGLLSPIHASLVVMSDIHLHRADDERARLLLRVVEQIRLGEVEYLVLLGDIFDFCLGSHPYFQKKFAPIGEALTAVSRAGTKVVYVEGNHEFRLIDLPWEGVHIVEHGTYALELTGGDKVQVAHGDMIYSHRRYKMFRRVVKSAFVTAIASRLPGPWMDRLAIGSSELSRSADQYRTVCHDNILAAVDSWLEKGPGDYGIFGHFHVPYAEPRRDGQKGGVFSVESWDSPNLLALREGAFYRSLLTRDGEGLHWHPAEPLVRKLLP